MSLIGNNFFNMVSVVQHIGPQSINGATVNGNAILEPWRTARQVTWVINVGDIGASGTGDIAFEQRQRVDGATWTAILNDDGGALVIADLDDATAFEDATVIATLDTSRVDSEVSDAVRMTYTTVTAASVIGVVAILSDLYTHPSGQTDEIFSLIDGVPDA